MDPKLKSHLDSLQAQKAEFDALDELTKALKNLPPVVDDDYPAARHVYEGKLQTFLEAAKANGRLDQWLGKTPVATKALKNLPPAVKLVYGAAGNVPETIRHFFGERGFNDASARFAEVVSFMDRHPGISAAYASLSRLPDLTLPEGRQMAVWTKTSDECGTSPGHRNPDACR